MAFPFFLLDWPSVPSLVGVGLLPGHEPGIYGLRLYDGDRHVATVQVERAALLGAIAALGVPTDNHAFAE